MSGMPAQVDVLAAVLRQRCPSFLSGNDVMLHKVRDGGAAHVWMFTLLTFAL